MIGLGLALALALTHIPSTNATLLLENTLQNLIGSPGVKLLGKDS